MTTLTNGMKAEDFRVGINNNFNELKASGDTASRPATPYTAQFYFDTTLGKPIWYNGATWVDATGATV